MNNKAKNVRLLVYTTLFVFFNILNCYLVTNNHIFRGINPYPFTFFMIINSFIGNLGFLLLFLGLAILLFKTDYSRGRFFMIVTIVLCLIFFSLSIYIQYYETFFSFYNLESFGLDAGGDALVFLLTALPSLLLRAKFIFLFAAAIIIFLFILFFRKHRKNSEFKSLTIVSGLNRLYIGLLVLGVGFLMMGNSLNAYFVDISDTWYEDNATTIHGVQMAGFFNYYFYDAYSYFFGKENYPEQKREEIINKLNKTYKQSNQMSPVDDEEYDNSIYEGIFSGKNLLLVQVESLNNFVIGLQVEMDDKQVEITPNLNKILGTNHAVYFDNYYHGVGIGNTSDAEFTAMTGLYPVGHNFTVFRYDESEYETLPRLFREQGYFSFSVHANIGSFYERAHVHPDVYGFDIHYSEEKLDLEDKLLLHSSLNDADMLRQTVRIMKEKSAEGPVFSFPITISNHIPYNRPLEGDEAWFPDLDDLFSDDTKFVNNHLLNKQYIGYLEHVHYTDYALGVMLDELEANGLADDTIVMLYGDHGCGIDIYNIFYENPDIFKNPYKEIIHYIEDPILRGLSERTFIQNIPFIIYDPSGETICAGGPLEPATISLVRGTNCTARTIANLFGLPSKYYFGADALSDAVTFAYSPRNHDIFVDGMTISGQSGDYYIYDEAYFALYTQEQIDKIINAVLDYKDFNDKLLKYRVFPALN